MKIRYSSVCSSLIGLDDIEIGKRYSIRPIWIDWDTNTVSLFEPSYSGSWLYKYNYIYREMDNYYVLKERGRTTYGSINNYGSARSIKQFEKIAPYIEILGEYNED